ncbi:MAG: DUF4019 domain-containing protein [Polyangiales bacterium]
MRNIMIAIGVLGLIATGCSKKEKPAGAGTDEGIAASNAWLAVIDAEQYDDSWNQACTFFRGVVPKDQWALQIAGVRGPLGSVLSREVASAEYTTKLPGAPDGEYVVIQYRTKFQNKADAVETVTPMRDPDGVYRVSGYYIR